MTSFTVNYQRNRLIEIKPNLYNFIFYRIPYNLLISNKVDLDLGFIVYLLSGKNAEGKDCLYVGTSTDGIKNRPTSHEDKNVDWKSCIVFTSNSNNFLNDSKIRYIEDRLRRMIDKTEIYINTTKSTSGKTVNKEEKEECETAIPYLLEIYDLCGINLTPKYSSDLDKYNTEKDTVPDSAKNSDFSQLNINSEMENWLREAEIIINQLDPELKTNVTKSYVSFKYNGISKTIAYCYPNKRENTIRILFQGTADWYSDPKIVPRPENMHNGDCKAMFFITDGNDLKYFRLFAETAIKGSKKKT